MLSRTADHLFWAARYMERAENLARLLGVNHRDGLLGRPADEVSRGWAAVLAIMSSLESYTTAYGRLVPERALTYLAFDPANPSSLVSCLASARVNARAVRGALTSEMWETMNATWLELRRRVGTSMTVEDVGEFLEWVKERAHLGNGVTLGTMLRDEGFHFWRLGTFIERADHTARVLDVQMKVLAPEGHFDDRPADYYSYSSLLRSLSAFEIYRRAYRDHITPARVAELLILRYEMPRSLRRCLHEVVTHLGPVANAQSRETERRAGELHAVLQFGCIEDLVARGLDDFLESFRERVGDLSRRIAADFLIPTGELTMQMHIRHETVYRYDRPLAHTVQQLRLTPRRDPWQRTLRWAVTAPGHSIEQQDAYGNVCHLVSVAKPQTEIRVVAHGIVEVDSTGGLLPAEETRLSPQVFLRATELTEPSQALRAFAGRACPRLAPHRRETGAGAPAPEVADLLDLAAAVREAVRYQPGAGDAQDSAAVALERGSGVCQDHAHLFVAGCRALGIPARYVSGYLYSGDSMVASHAWADAWLGDSRGWYSLDVTHGAPAGPLHCRLAVGRDYLDASPVRGMRAGGGEEEMKVSVFVARTPQEQQQHQQQHGSQDQQQQQQQQ